MDPRNQVLGGVPDPHEEWTILGDTSQLIVKYRLFGRCQERCGFSLSVLQQLVYYYQQSRV